MTVKQDMINKTRQAKQQYLEQLEEQSTKVTKTQSELDINLAIMMSLSCKIVECNKAIEQLHKL